MAGKFWGELRLAWPCWLNRLENQRSFFFLLLIVCACETTQTSHTKFSQHLLSLWLIAQKTFKKQKGQKFGEMMIFGSVETVFFNNQKVKANQAGEETTEMEVDLVKKMSWNRKMTFMLTF
jgi:hypothetical protein